MIDTTPAPKSERVAVLGASANTERYGYKAFSMLREYGHEAIPVHPALDALEGVPVAHNLEEIEGPVDTLTLYVNPKRLDSFQEAIISLKPKRVIFNPGTESPSARARFEEAGIACVEACTLVMLRTGQF